MSVTATVIIPTFDHGPMLRYSVASALAQTVKDIEVIVIGDGAPPIAAEIVQEFARVDDRVHFLPRPKSPRTGEPYRDAALASARGEIVCYLSDDDLWFPEHVESMRSLLADGGFAHALPVRIDADGSLAGWAVDLRYPIFRDAMLRGQNWIPLSCGAHTLAAYRRLPVGWETTPEGIPTDLYLWQKFLRLEGCPLVSGTRPTVLHFPSPARSKWTADQRLDELAQWSSRVGDRAWRDAFLGEVLDSVVRHRGQLEAHALSLDRTIGEEREQAQTLLGALEKEREKAHALLRSLEQERERVRQRDEVIESIRNSVTWRLRTRLLRHRAIGAVARAVAVRAAGRATARSRRAPR